MSEKTKNKILNDLKEKIDPVISNIPSGEEKTKIGFMAKLYIFIFGFLLPFITLGVEVTTRMCAGALFDPLPTPYHALLIGMVPLSSLLFLYFLNKKTDKISNFINGMAIGISTFYTIIFIPVIPIGIILILFMGIGFLPLAPLMSMIASFIIFRFFIKNQKDNRKFIISGIIFSLFCIVALELPVTLTRYAMELASSSNKETKLKGINLLRNYGNYDVMLRYCYVIRGKSPDLISFIIEHNSTMSPENARDIYYHVTGKTFNSVPAPDELKSRLQLTDEFIFDNDQAGEMVGARIKNLNAASSRLDGIIDQKSGITYSEWTMTFKNAANWDQEARMQIKLPPNSTVSRLTLWVNGIPQEAAFAGKQQVRQAYQSVVAKKRDPVLVTSNGVDRILVQCFPVPANSKGEMKIRLGISSPMYFKNKKESIFVLPQIIERNFNIDKDFKHSIWYDSKNYISALDDKIYAKYSNQVYSLKKEIVNSDFEKFPYSIKIARKNDINDSWTIDTTDPKYIIKQKIEEIKNSPDKKLTFVIDGSVSTNKYVKEISEVIKNIPDSINTNILVASDYTNQIDGRNNLEKSQSLEKYKFIGGQDNAEALIKAIDNKDSKIIWLHGAQPEFNYYNNSKVEELLYTLQRLNNNVINEIQFSNGPNIIAGNNQSYKYFDSIPITGNLQQSIQDFVNKSINNTNDIEFIRERVIKFQQEKVNESSLHLEKIWANENVNKLLEKNNEKEAVKIASNYHIVTPVSGAVVLENAQQFANNNLKPVNQSSAPIIPEPEEWLLIFVVGLFIIYSVFNRKKSWQKV